MQISFHVNQVPINKIQDSLSKLTMIVALILIQFNEIREM